MNASIESTVSAPKGDSSKGHNGMQLEPDANFAFTAYRFAIAYGTESPKEVATVISINPDQAKFPIPAGFLDRDGQALVNGVEYLVPVGDWPPPAKNAKGEAVSVTVSNQPSNWGTTNPCKTAEAQGKSNAIWLSSTNGSSGLQFFYDNRSTGGIAAGIGFMGDNVGPVIAYGILSGTPPATGTFVVSVNKGASTLFGTRTAPTSGTWYSPF